MKNLIKEFYLFMATIGSKLHVIIDKILGGLDRANLRQWKRGMLFFLKLHNKNRDDK